MGIVDWVSMGVVDWFALNTRCRRGDDSDERCRRGDDRDERCRRGDDRDERCRRGDDRDEGERRRWGGIIQVTIVKKDSMLRMSQRQPVTNECLPCKRHVRTSSTHVSVNTLVPNEKKCKRVCNAAFYARTRSLGTTTYSLSFSFTSVRRVVSHTYARRGRARGTL